MTPEKIIQNAVIDYLKKLQQHGYNVYVERRQAGGFSYKMGIADLYAVINGRHLEIEVKRPGGELSTMQEKWRDKCKMLCIDWICVDNLDIFKHFISNYLQKS